MPQWGRSNIFVRLYTRLWNSHYRVTVLHRMKETSFFLLWYLQFVYWAEVKNRNHLNPEHLKSQHLRFWILFLAGFQMISWTIQILDILDHKSEQRSSCLRTHTHTHTHTHAHSKTLQQSLTPSYALQLCSFPWCTAAPHKGCIARVYCIIVVMPRKLQNRQL